MSKFQYFKRVVNGVTTELHLHENRGEVTVSKIYPEPIKDEIYYHKEFVELEDTDEFLDEGLKTGIFGEKPVPTASGEPSYSNS